MLILQRRLLAHGMNLPILQGTVSPDLADTAYFVLEIKKRNKADDTCRKEGRSRTVRISQRSAFFCFVVLYLSSLLSFSKTHFYWLAQLTILVP